MAKKHGLTRRLIIGRRRSDISPSLLRGCAGAFPECYFPQCKDYFSCTKNSSFRSGNLLIKLPL